MPGEGGDNIVKRTAVGATWLILLRMLTRGLGLISTLVLARALVPADFGLVAMATTFAAAVDALSELGLLEALVRRPHNDRTMLDTAFTLQAIRGLLSGAVVATASLWAGAWFHEPRLGPILLILAGLSVLTGFENIGIVEFRRSMRFSMEFLLTMLPRLTAFIVTVSWALTWRTYWALVAGIAAAKILRLLMTYLVHPHRPRPALAGWRELAGFSFWSWVGSLVNMVWFRCEPFILGPVLGSAALGLYLLSNEVAVLPVSELVAPIAAALFSAFSLAQNRGTDTVATAAPIIASLMLVVTPLAIGLSGTAGYVVAGLLGERWAGAAPLIAICAWNCLFSPISAVVWNLMSAKGHLRQNVACVALAAIIKIIAVYLAAQTGSLTVVATAGVVVVGLESAIYLVQLRVAGGRNLRAAGAGVVRTATAGVLTAAALWASGFGWVAVAMHPLSALALGIAVAAASILFYILCLAALFLLTGRPDGPERHVASLLAGFLPARFRPSSPALDTRPGRV